MAGAFFGLDIANTALAAAQTLMDVAGQNIANDATPGYSRQVADLATTAAYAQPDMGGTYTPQLGTGVDVSSVHRVRANYLDSLFRTTQSDVGLQSTLQNYLSTTQSVLNEPGSNGLSATMNRFFGDFQTLSQDPQSAAARTSVQQDGQALAAQVQQIYQGLQNVGLQAQTQATQDVQTANADLQQLANLNTTIAQAQALGQQPNDLLDKRDSVLDSLSSLMNINVSTQVTTVGQNQVTQVTVTTPASGGGAVTLVDGGQYGSLSVTPGASGPQFTMSAQDAVSGTSSAIAPTGGSIGAAYQFVNQDLNPASAGPPPSLMYQLNQAVSQLASAVNAQQQAGFQNATGTWAAGPAFFTASGSGSPPISAANIQENPLIAQNANYVAAASTSGAAGDGSNATQIADIAGQPSGPLSQYASFVSNVGGQVDLAQNLGSTAQSLLTQVTSQRQQAAGVSINQEMTNLVQAQAMYTAASKVAQIMDSSLQALISAVQP